VWSRLSREVGSRTFGRDPARYAFGRPEYPPEVYRILGRMCGLRPGARVFEIGAGTGLATRELLRRGADPLVAIEPDRRLARYLRRSLAERSEALIVRPERFRSARLPSASFDLGVSATAFHWLEERVALRKVARLLRPGGWWAAWWDVFGDPRRRSRFQHAVDPLFRTVPSYPRAPIRSRVPPQLDRPARLAALRRDGNFHRATAHLFRRNVTFETGRLVALHATYSPIALLPPSSRRRFLHELASIADDQFGGRVTMEILTPVYTAERV
jgi:SAM-dependent methyltransferase